MRLLRIVIAFLSLAWAVSAQAREPALPNDIGNTMLAALSVRDAGLVVLREDGELHRSVHGTLGADTIVPIGAASRWLTVATILTVFDEGKLDLDVPAARYVKELDRPDKNMLTLRQCLACTAGLSADVKKDMQGWDMAKFAEEVARSGLREHPGSGFRDGDVGFQIAAVAAERVTGKSWHQLFAERIAKPLGMKHTQFGTLQPPGEGAGTTALPWAAAGAVSTLDDYSRFVRMLVGKGRVGYRNVLGDATVAMMWRDQVAADVEVRAKWLVGERVRYGLGTWIQVLGDETVRASAPGARGFATWLDLDLGLGGVCVARTGGQWLEKLHDLQCDVRSAALSPAVAGTMEVVELDQARVERRYTLHVPPKKGPEPMPLLLVLHCDGGSADQVGAATGFAEDGVRAGYVVAFPQGSSSRLRKVLGWNTRNDGAVDDVGFLRAVVADIRLRAAIDPARIYAVGRGGGGKMCHRLARQAADVFTGIAAIDAAMTFTSADSATPIGVLLVQVADAGAPEWTKALADARPLVPVNDALTYYLARNGLRTSVRTTEQDTVRFDTYDVVKSGRPAPPVTVITIEGGRHTWPGARRKGAWLAADSGSRFDATRAILDFFTSLGPRRPMPAAPADPGARPR